MEKNWDVQSFSNLPTTQRSLLSRRGFVASSMTPVILLFVLCHPLYCVCGWTDQDTFQSGLHYETPGFRVLKKLHASRLCQMSSFWIGTEKTFGSWGHDAHVLASGGDNQDMAGSPLLWLPVRLLAHWSFPHPCRGVCVCASVWCAPRFPLRCTGKSEGLTVI